MITIKDIAMKANVSPSTVSRALNKDKRIPLETQKKIETIAQEFNYSPNKFARHLVSKNYPDKTIGVIFPELIHRYFFELLQGIDEYIDNTDFSLMIYNVSKRRDDIFRRIISESLNGLIIMGFTLTNNEKEVLSKYNIPFVYLDIVDKDENFITCDNYYGGKLVGNYFLSKKCSNVCYIGVTEQTNLQDERLRGFEEVLSNNNIKLAKKFIDKDERKSKELTYELLNNNPEIDSFFYFCDEMAYGGISAIKNNGGDKIVVGYDDLYPSKYIPLTTVSQPSRQIGFCGAKAISDFIKNKELPLCQIMLKPTLIER